MSININHKTTTIVTDNDELLQIANKGAIIISDGTYLNESKEEIEIKPLKEYEGALRYNKEKGIMQYCDGIKWRDINGDYKKTSEIVWSLLF